MTTEGGGLLLLLLRLDAAALTQAVTASA